jgi:microsomal dipeptidase-like Zn-dependent dipeptidase
MSPIISDLHVHSGLKAFGAAGHPDYEDFTIWDFFPPQENAIRQLNLILRAAIKETAKASQANLDACVKANLRMPILSVYPIERQMFELDPQEPFRRLFKFLLKGRQHSFLGSAITGYPLDRVEAIMEQVTNDQDEGYDYFVAYRQEVAYLFEQTLTRSKNFPEYRFRMATDYAQLQEWLTHEQTIVGLVTVEGGHSFGHYLKRSTNKKEWEALDTQEQKVLRSSMLRNISAVKSEAGGQRAPFFVTFCHHFNNLLAGHARSFSDKSSLGLGIQSPGSRHLFNQEPGLNRGFTPLGREVLELFLNRYQGRRILIDTKHMSVATRQEFYRIIRRKREEENDTIPIIHSHAAINGWQTLEQAHDKEDTAALDQGHFFSRWQINLTDEDILEMYDSDGLIGVVLHEGRMPGEGLQREVRQIKKKLQKAPPASRRRQLLERQLNDLYLKLIWSTIFHIIKVVHDGRAASGWKMIALGSDYDGVVEPINTFPEVASFQALRTELMAYLEEGKELFYAYNGEAHPLPAAEVRALQFGQSPEELLHGILFGNNNRFLRKYFTPAYLTEKEVASATG